MATYNIIYDKNVDVSILQQNLENSGASIVKIYSSLNVITISAVTQDFSSVAGIIKWEENKTIEATPCTASWAVNRLYSAGLPMVSTFTPDNTGEGSTVYLVDSGIDTTHPEFESANISVLYSYDNTPDDYSGHGTGVGSLIIGKTLGIAKSASLKSVKILFSTQIQITDLLDAFTAILNDHLLTPSVVKVINCSWSIPKSEILDTKITELEAAGLVVVAAAGNTTEAANNLSPVGLDSVLGVGASDAYDRVLSGNWGPEVDITAPGVDVDIAIKGGTIATASGTSLATGLVSGIVLQHITKSPEKTAAQIQQEVIAAGIPDMLFRNETIYGTTPNLIAHALGIPNVISISNYFVDVQKGTTVNQPISYNEQLVSTIVTGPSLVLSSGKIRVNPDWVSYDVTSKTVKLSPPADCENGIYLVWIAALDSNDQRLSWDHISANVYQSSPEENTVPVKIQETYFLADPTLTTVTVTPWYCTQGCPSFCTQTNKGGTPTCGCCTPSGPCSTGC